MIQIHPTPSSTGPVSTRDFIVSRLAETYLGGSEADLKAGNPDTGLARLNEVRRRAEWPTPHLRNSILITSWTKEGGSCWENTTVGSI